MKAADRTLTRLRKAAGLRAICASCILLCVLVGLYWTRSTAASGTAARTRFVFVTFSPKTSTMAMLGSSDLKTWKRLGADQAYSDPGGFAVGVHDPSIMHSRDGSYYVAYTTSEKASFGIARSPDLMHWTFLKRVPTSAIAGVMHSWAPEWFVDDDKKVHVFFSANTSAATNAGFSIYEVHPMAGSGLNGSWSAPVRITGTNLPSNIIDPFVVKLGSAYNLWYANGSRGRSGGTIELMRSKALTSGYTVVKSGNWSGWEDGVDGPTVIRTGPHRWTLCFENASYAGQEKCAVSPDDFATFSKAHAIVAPVQAQHGTIIAIAAPAGSG